MIVWGGYGESNDANTGGRYNPSMNSWTTTSTASAPAARSSHTAVWTGGEMIVWGGFGDSGSLNTGGRYNPSLDSWVPTGSNNAPSARISHTAVWTGSEMIVWRRPIATPTRSLTLVADIIWLWITGRLHDHQQRADSATLSTSAIWTVRRNDCLGRTEAAPSAPIPAEGIIQLPITGHLPVPPTRPLPVTSTQQSGRQTR